MFRTWQRATNHCSSHHFSTAFKWQLRAPNPTPGPHSLRSVHDHHGPFQTEMSTAGTTEDIHRSSTAAQFLARIRSFRILLGLGGIHQHSYKRICVGKNGLWTKLRHRFWGRYCITELILPRSQEALSVAHTTETLCEQEHSPNSSSDFATIRHNGYKTRLITKLPAGQRCQSSVPVPTQSVPHGTCRIWSHTVLGPGRYTALLFQLWSPGQLLHQKEEKGARPLIKVSQD